MRLKNSEGKLKQFSQDTSTMLKKTSRERNIVISIGGHGYWYDLLTETSDRNRLKIYNSGGKDTSNEQFLIWHILDDK